jgi:UDP-N-acetylmuramoyl-tripeptide--D-alanyl-D-alanine ligase
MTTSQLYELYCQYSNIVTDSRKIKKDCLFFALKGERFNGNQFAKDAIAQGAKFAIIDEKKFQESEHFILVDDVLKTLQELANFHRKQFDIPIIGITGSNGKTTTKELLSEVLSSSYQTHFTKGNFNNHIGVPLTLLEMPKTTQIAVIEMGANHVGEIEFLCKIAEPTHGVITNIGRAHLEGFGGIEGVKKGKSELYRFLEKNRGMAFVNNDEPFLKELSEGIRHRLIYEKSETPDPNYHPFETKFLEANPFVKVAFLAKSAELIAIQSQLIGTYNFNNLMTAITIGRYFKVPAEKIKSAIENYTPTNNRSQVVKVNSNTFILDAYNANPTSMSHALNNFSKMKADAKIVILGDMLELGEYSFSDHSKILNQAEALDFDQIIIVGSEFGKIPKNEGIIHFKNTSILKKWFDEQNYKKTHFLIKGSRSIGLEKILT